MTAPYGGAQLASWGLRVVGAIIDNAIPAGLFVLLLFVGGGIGGGGGAAIAVLGGIGAFGFFVWQLVVQGQTGQTIGKKAVGIKLVRESDGQVVGPGLSFGRFAVHYVTDGLCYLGYLWPLWDAKKQTWADKILSTLVIKV